MKLSCVTNKVMTVETERKGKVKEILNIIDFND